MKSRGLIAILFLLLAGTIYWGTTNYQKNNIYDKIESIGGEVVDIDLKIINKGPFILYSNNTPVYKVEYIQNNKEKEAWVKFGYFKSKWKIDEE